MKATFILVLGLIAICSRADIISDMLKAHNDARAAYKVQPLKWNTKLASQALSWATYLAKNDLRSHSGTSGVGENLARGTSGKYQPVRLFNLWLAEKQYFIVGKNYPDCSTTGSKSDVGHYTQVMWATTTEVGCGFADYKKAVLVCQYSAAGNIKGRSVFNKNGNNPGWTEPTIPTIPDDIPEEEEDIPTDDGTGSNPDVGNNSTTPNNGTVDTNTTLPNNGTVDTNTTIPDDGTVETNTTNTTTPTPTVPTDTTPSTTFPGISWSDFKGKVDKSSSFWSYTIWKAPYTYSSKTSGNNVKITVNTRCELDENDSWVKSQYKSDELLTHELGHYYIGSIFAMTFKKQAEAKTFSKSSYKSEISKLYNNLLDDFLDYEVRYDKETNHFNNKAMQKKWNADLINQINALKDYWFY